MTLELKFKRSLVMPKITFLHIHTDTQRRIENIHTGDETKKTTKKGKILTVACVIVIDTIYLLSNVTEGNGCTYTYQMVLNWIWTLELCHKFVVIFFFHSKSSIRIPCVVIVLSLTKFNVGWLSRMQTINGICVSCLSSSSLRHRHRSKSSSFYRFIFIIVSETTCNFGSIELTGLQLKTRVCV